MTIKTARRARYAPTGPLRKRGTRPLGDTGLLREMQPSEQLLAQVDKLLNETELISARFAAISDVALAINSSLRPDDILEVIVDKADHALGFDYCAVGMLSEDGTQYMLRPLAWPEGEVADSGDQIFSQEDGLP